MKPETASQTAGPYVHIGCTPNFSGVRGVYQDDLGSNPIHVSADDKKIAVTGRVIDGDGLPVLDAMIEIWQADANGVYISNQNKDTKTFSGWGRCASNMETGEFRFDTIKPGQVSSNGDTLQAPHITIWIVARGINIGLHTRMYFADEETANKTDPLLTSIQDQKRASTLLAQPIGNGIYQFDIHLQGDRETVFLDI